MKFNHRKEILLSIKYVSKVIKSDFFINEKFLIKNKIDLLVHGTDNKNKIKKKYLKIFKRTRKVSSSKIRKNLKKDITSY